MVGLARISNLEHVGDIMEMKWESGFGKISDEVKEETEQVFDNIAECFEHLLDGKARIHGYITGWVDCPRCGRAELEWAAHLEDGQLRICRAECYNKQGCIYMMPNYQR